MSRKGRKKRHNAGTIGVVIIVLAFLLIMSVQIYKLKQKDDLYAEREENLMQQIADEQERASELEEMDLYTQSIEYIKDMANRLGLVFDNEIIFKESNE
jgi:cell division protein DivIC